MDKIGAPESAGFDRGASFEPKSAIKKVYGILPAER